MRRTILALAALTSFAAFADNKPPATPSASASASAVAITPVQVGVRVTAPSAASQPAPVTLTTEQSIDFERSVSSAISPGLAASNGACLGSAGVGVQGPGFGISGGSTTLDEGCDTRYDTMMLHALGETDSAIARACMKPEIREARELAGRACPQPKRQPVSGYTGNDPIVIERLRRQGN